MKTIELTQEQVAIVDEDAYDALIKFKWFAKWDEKAQTFYAVRKESQKNLPMHRVILGATPEDHVDHIDHNGLNNQRANLRIATQSQNGGNRQKRMTRTSSQYKGVTFRKRPGRRRHWRAKITFQGRQVELGMFFSEDEAAEAYNKAARLYFGDFAYLNMIEGKNDCQPQP